MTNLARIRKSSGISQKELANLCGISIKTIQAYEQRLKDINRAEVKTLFKISQILMVDINDLLESKDLVIEKAYAKINLNLKVIGKKDGYHQLETIMAPVDLFDTLIFEKNNQLEVIGIDIENSSIHKAAKLFIDTYHVSPCKITVVKRIPIEAGLGGGSADSSAVLRGMNRLYNLNKSLYELESLANQLGSDNVYCLYNEFALCKGRGEKVNIIKKSFSYNILLIKPSFGLSTKEVFNNIKIKKSESNTNQIIKCINDYEFINNNIENDLFEASMLVNQKMLSLSNRIKELGFIPHMTGSGSCLFVISLDIEKLKTLSSHFKDCFIKICLIKNCF